MKAYVVNKEDFAKLVMDNLPNMHETSQDIRPPVMLRHLTVNDEMYIEWRVEKDPKEVGGWKEGLEVDFSKFVAN